MSWVLSLCIAWLYFTWINCFMVSWFDGFSVSWFLGCLGCWFLGLLLSLILCILVSWCLGFLVSCLRGFSVSLCVCFPVCWFLGFFFSWFLSYCEDCMRMEISVNKGGYCRHCFLVVFCLCFGAFVCNLMVCIWRRTCADGILLQSSTDVVLTSAACVGLSRKMCVSDCAYKARFFGRRRWRHPSSQIIKRHQKRKSMLHEEAQARWHFFKFVHYRHDSKFESIFMWR